MTDITTNVPRRMATWKKVLFIGLSVCLGLGVGLILLEISLRIILGPVSHEITNADPILHHFTGNNPGINSFGFYDKEYPQEKGTDTFRIMILGDSLVRRGDGGVNFVDVLENRFARESSGSRTVEVWNCGIDSYSPALEYLLIRHRLADLQPDLVVSCVFMGNDFNDDAVYEAKMEYDESGKPIRCVPDKAVKDSTLVPGQIPLPFKNYLRTHSRLYRELSTVYNFFLHVVGLRRGEWGKAKIEVDRPAPIGTLTLNITDNHLNLMLRNIRLTKDLLAQQGCRFLVVLIPIDIQVDAEAIRDGERSAFRPEDIDVANQNETRLKAALEQEQIEVLDLLPQLIERKSGRLYIIGSHFSALGHETVAEILFPELTKRTIE